jgi:predicted transcriptional regulator of viral defense system
MYMTFDELVTHVGSLPFFDLSTVLQLSGEDISKIRTQLHRWMKSGKVISLRREWYTLAGRYRKVVLYPAVLANELYKPSYLSLLWALNYYGLIPEKVVTYTSITPRAPRSFTNRFGTFHYSHVKQPFFFGFASRIIEEKPVWLAEPEKALLDLWYLNSGEWKIDRLSSMRFQNFEFVSYEKLQSFASRTHSPRIERAVVNWKKLVEREKEGEFEL